MSKSQRKNKRKRSKNGLIPRLLLKFKNLKFKKIMHNKKLLRLIIISILFIAVTFLVVKIFTAKNAIAVFLDETEIGIMAKDKNVTPENLQAIVVSKLKEYNGTNVEVYGDLKFLPVHASKTNSQDHIISEAYNNYLKTFNYRIEALQISVDGNPIVILKNEEEYKDVKNKIIEPYIKGNEKIIESDFYEEVSIDKKFFVIDSLYSKEEAYKKLTEVTEIPTKYTVKKGDVFSKIASNFGLTSDELASKNPQLPSISDIKIGDELNIVTKKPLLSIKTVEETKYIDVERREVVNEVNSDKRSEYKRLLQQGSDGEAEVTARIVKVNGTVVEEIPIDKKIIKEPVPEIWEIGK